MINKRFILPSIVLVVVAGWLSGWRNSTNKELPESPAVGYSIRNKYTELVVRTLDKKVGSRPEERNNYTLFLWSHIAKYQSMSLKK